MIFKYFSELWSTAAPAVGNHLWQSTLFAVVAGLLTLVLRKNHARARYWLWLAASLKFLVPFSLLVTVGSHLPWARGSRGTTAGLAFAAEEVSQPFAQPMMPVTSQASPVSLKVFSSLPHLFPAILAAIWLCGFAFVLCVWWRRWRQISLALRDAVPLLEGREVDALRRLEHMGGIRKPTRILLSRTSLEPGIFGIARPVLVWPEGISGCLNDQQVETVLAHEVWHVRYRDNLTAAIHMTVEAILWFYPLVWFLGARLVEERERACDERVLELGNKANVYAESILKTCEFCVESPMACVSGVTGADLKKRIVRIMTQRIAKKLDFNRKLLLSVAGSIAVALPVLFGLLHGTQSRAASSAQSTDEQALVYEVASIKPDKSGTNMVRLMYSPDGLRATNCPLQMLIHSAYQVEDNQISGAPAWLTSEKYDIEAKMDSAVAEGLKKLSDEERRTARQKMLQALLAERFNLAIHRETKELSIYALVTAKNGPKLKEAKPGDTYPNGIKGPDGIARAGFMRMGRGELTGQGLPISALVGLLTQQLGRTVVDKTGLTAKYDFTLKWTPEDSEGGSLRGPGGAPPQSDSAPAADTSAPSIFTSLQEQLGLKLESQKGPVEILVIDHVEKPSEN
jgi:bla regulator protein blaR1